ncbi:MAG: hypothetical protein KIT48_20995 [Pseudolabrys sp.]|nr:hypothetical protein [Pseudolabrys sp.]
MALSERREPTFHAVARDPETSYSAASHHGASVHHAIRPSSHFTRFVSGFQAISTLIGVPLALASGYSLYRANFAPETTCANLRASIVQMLDKNVDAATRRMLVKRDIESFEAQCGAVDPDAHAAFKALLAADKPTAVAAKPQTVAKVPVAAAKETSKPVAKEPVKEAAREPAKEPVKESVKAELRPALAEKKPVAAPQAVAAAPDADAHEGGMSDTRWLDAVRSALVETPDAAPATPAKREVAKAEPPKPEPVKAEAAKPEPIATEPAKAEPEKAALKPVVPSKPGEPVLQPAWATNPPPAAATSPAAPSLPPAVEVAGRPEPAQDRVDHPVPPGSVPSAQYATDSSWVGKIPFVGRMIER